MPIRHVKKRCIPKEGMPHAHKACQKKREKRKGKEKGSPYPRKIKEREKSCKGVPPPFTKNIYTLAHLDQGL